jgi:hypothetical protein
MNYSLGEGEKRQHLHCFSYLCLGRTKVVDVADAAAADTAKFVQPSRSQLLLSHDTTGRNTSAEAGRAAAAKAESSLNVTANKKLRSLSKSSSSRASKKAKGSSTSSSSSDLGRDSPMFKNYSYLNS